MNQFFKKTAAICLTAVLTAGTMLLPAFAKTGDLNADGKTNTQDARKLLRHNARLELLPDELLPYADFNADGKVTSTDARLVLRSAAKLESLETYENYYMQMKSGNQDMTIGCCNGDLYAYADMMGMPLGMLLKADGSLVIIDDAKKQYGVLTKQNLESLSQMTGEEIDFSTLIQDSDLTNMLSKPAALLDQGYSKSETTYQSAPAQVYTKTENDVETSYYFNGMILLAMETKPVSDPSQAQTTVFSNFSTDPASKIYAYESNHYQKRDPIEMMLEMVDLF